MYFFAPILMVRSKTALAKKVPWVLWVLECKPLNPVKMPMAWGGRQNYSCAVPVVNCQGGPSHEPTWTKPWDPNWHGSHEGLLLQRLMAVGRVGVQATHSEDKWKGGHGFETLQSNGEKGNTPSPGKAAINLNFKNTDGFDTTDNISMSCVFLPQQTPVSEFQFYQSTRSQPTIYWPYTFLTYLTGHCLSAISTGKYAIWLMERARRSVNI